MTRPKNRAKVTTGEQIAEDERRRTASPSAAMTDEAFYAWCESAKPCKYCHRTFFGPVCDCEKGRDD
jgi:hypothetical protein